MPDWQDIVNRQHERHYPNDEQTLIVRAPATDAELAELRGVLGFEIPLELESFYRTMNGFGHEPTSDEIVWGVMPISEVPGTIERCRNWFNKTHPDLAARFFPLIDWYCGDYSGYLLSEEGTVEEGLFPFDHEEYGSDPKRPSSEFLCSYDRLLEEFLATE